MEALPVPSPGTGLMFLSLGVAAGVAAIFYIRTIIGALSLMDRLYWPAVARLGAPIGPLGWFAPGALGGGDVLTQLALSIGNNITFVILDVPALHSAGPTFLYGRNARGLVCPYAGFGCPIPFALCYSLRPTVILPHAVPPTAAFGYCGNVGVLHGRRQSSGYRHGSDR